MEYFEIGKIVGTHGLDGEMKVFPLAHDIKIYDDLGHIYIDDICHEIKSVRYHKKYVLVKLCGITSIEDAEKFKNKIIKITEDMSVPLEEGEYYIRDIYGLKVYEEDGKYLGEIVEVIFTASNEVYAVKMEDGKELLLPAIKECIKEININERKMIVKLMEGLL